MSQPPSVSEHTLALKRVLCAIGIALPVLLAATAGVLSACVSTASPNETVTEDAGAPVGAPCTVTTDCIVGSLCGYAEDAGCSAQGVCVPEDLSCTNDGPIVCACDGTPLGLACIYGPGYAAEPVASLTPGCQPDLDASFD
jgi:hypothetical protein